MLLFSFTFLYFFSLFIFFFFASVLCSSLFTFTFHNFPSSCTSHFLLSIVIRLFDYFLYFLFYFLLSCSLPFFLNIIVYFIFFFLSHFFIFGPFPFRLLFFFCSLPSTFIFLLPLLSLLFIFSLCLFLSYSVTTYFVSFPLCASLFLPFFSIWHITSPAIDTSLPCNWHITSLQLT